MRFGKRIKADGVIDGECVMGYWKYWKMTRHPFSVRNPSEGFFAMGSVGEAVRKCEGVIEHPHSLGLLVGSAGVGKTRVLRHLWSKCSSQEQGNLQFHYVDLENASALELLERIAMAVLPSRKRWSDPEGHEDLRWTGARNSRLMVAVEECLSMRSAAGIPSVFFLDHLGMAHREASQALAALLSRPFLGSLILSLEREQIPMLPKKLQEHCDRRIEVPEWRLETWCEAVDCILQQCGSSAKIFESDALGCIYEYGGGNARRMVQLADYSLFQSAEDQKDRVDVQTVYEVHQRSFSTSSHLFQTAQ
ncbi:MAG: ATP-binding protein [Planctomycetota bacterium]|jgi:hypothetical protein